MSGMQERYAAVRARVDAAAEKVGRDPAEVTLVAVSKRKPAADVVDAYGAGARAFGENYVQELVDKAGDVGSQPDLSWHFVGHLQRNKANALLSVPGLQLIHGIDSAKLLRALDTRAEHPVGVLIHVNVAGEATKSGCAPEDLEALVAEARACTKLKLRGLMTMPPPTEDPNEARGHFRALRDLRDRFDAGSELSMGMSGDFEVAVEEGATLVRVGTAIFGART
ncbi:MAG: YggS family pyridoxal phosphate-dependent enzyme [Myxococcota bacterium]